jgi:hypothetical protein
VLARLSGRSADMLGYAVVRDGGRLSSASICIQVLTAIRAAAW